MSLDLYNIAAIFGLLLAGLLIVLILQNRKNSLFLRRELERAKQDLSEVREQHSSAQEQLEEFANFQNSMDSAKLTTKLQSSRVRSHEQTNVQIPEKYQYINSLYQKGMSSDEIASLLNISMPEAEQLIALSKLASGNKTK